MNNELGLVPPKGAGSFKSPIFIPSSRMDCSRVVGYEDPSSTHAMFWFTNSHHDENNSTYYVDGYLGLFCRMLHIPDENAAAHHAH